jgi:hypothetical protein
MRKNPKDERLAELESDFRPLLISCLEECRNGRWGLFAQNNSAEAAKYLNWNEAKQLKAMADEIRALRAEFGQPSPLVERFLYYYTLRGSNVRGEPKLSQAFLDEIERGGFQ